MDIWKVLEYTSSVTIVGLLIWLVKLIFHDKLDARWHYFIWLVLLVRLIVPVDFSLIRTPVSIFQGIPVDRLIELGRMTADRKGQEEIFALLGQVYLCGAALLGGYYLVTWAILRVSLGVAAKADESTRKYVEDIAVKYRLKACGDIRICRSSTPYVCGLIHPVLALPEDNVRPEEPIILHELLHRKWKDVAVNIGLRIVRTLNWFNPIIWFLTGVIQNDSEALCDQRVLEYYKEDMQRDYGEMLLAMTREKKRNPIKTGTSNMASSYRNMRIRIRRICDFHRVPGGIGFVAFCITLILAAACIGASAQTCGFEPAEYETEAQLQRELLKAQLYHAHTPEEAVDLFLRSAVEHNVFYRAAALPQERAEAYEEFVGMCWNQGNLNARGELAADGALQSGEPGAYFSYFPKETLDVQQICIYNLQYDEDQGTATVCARLRGGQEGTNFTEWKLELTKEDGWKVWLAGDTGRETGEYQILPLLYGSTQLGDFRLEVLAYNEGHFDQMEWGALDSWNNAVFGSQGGAMENYGTDQADIFPECFSTEYKIKEFYITYLGQNPLDGHSVRVEITEDGKEAPVTPVPPEVLDEEAAAMADTYGASGDGYAIKEWRGGNLVLGEPYLVGGGGNGSPEAGWGWKAEDRICAHVRIYVDGGLVEEGELWSGNR